MSELESDIALQQEKLLQQSLLFWLIEGHLKQVQEHPLFSVEARPTLKLFLMVPTAWPGSGVLKKPMNLWLSLRNWYGLTGYLL